MADDRPRQRVVRVPGSRRARLTPVAGTDPEPETGSTHDHRTAPAPGGVRGPNDDRMRQDVPPHY